MMSMGTGVFSAARYSTGLATTAGRRTEQKKRTRPSRVLRVPGFSTAFFREILSFPPFMRPRP